MQLEVISPLVAYLVVAGISVYAMRKRYWHLP